MGWFDRYGFFIIYLLYLILLIVGFQLMGHECEKEDMSKATQRSNRDIIVYVLILAVLSIPAVFGSMMPWLPNNMHLVICAAFALLILIFPYWQAIDMWRTRR